MLDSLRSTLQRPLHARAVRTVVWVGGLVSIALALNRAVHIATTTHPVDFAVYLMGASHLFGGHLYTTYLPYPKKPFTYPPVAALLFVPLTAIPRVTAQVVWALISTLVLVALLDRALRSARPEWCRSDAVRWSLVLSFPALALNPVAMTFSYGQINLLLALLVLADLTGEHTLWGHAIPRGVLTGIAAALKLTPLIFVPLLFATKQARAGYVALTTFLGCGIVMLGVAPAESWSYWTKYAFDASRVGGVVYIANQSLRSAIVRFAHAHVSDHLLVLVVLVAGVAGLAVAVWAYRSSSALLGIVLCAATGLLVSPITWGHHLVWIVPVVVWLALAPDRPAFGRVWAGVAALLFWYGPIWRVPYGSGRELHDSFAQLTVGNSYTIAMVLFVVGMAVMLLLRRSRLRRPGRTSSHQSPHREDDDRDPIPIGRESFPASGVVPVRAASPSGTRARVLRSR